MSGSFLGYVAAVAILRLVEVAARYLISKLNRAENAERISKA